MSPLGVGTGGPGPGSGAESGISDELLAHLRREEGEVLYAYQDQLGYWTIGVGHLIDRQKGGGITRAQSATLLRDDLARAEASALAAYPWYSRLDQVRRGIVLALIFQLGAVGWAAFRSTHAALAAGDWPTAAERLLASRWAQQVPARARRVTAILLAGDWAAGTAASLDG